MPDNSIYGISNEVPLPWWIERNPWFQQLIYNPIFQRDMQRRYKSPVLNELKGLIAAILCFIGLLVYYKANSEDPEIGQQLFVVLSVVPFGLLAAVGFVRELVICLVSAPLTMRQEIGSLRMNAVLATPLYDSEVFFSIPYQVLLRSWASHAGTIVFFIIFWISTYSVVLVNGWGYFEHFRIMDGDESTIPLRLVFLAVQCALFLHLACLAGSMYGVRYGVLRSIVLTVAHVGIAFLFMLLFHYVSTMIFPGDVGPLEFSWQTVGVDVFNTLFLLLVVWLTGRIGVMIFARYRRPGFFEPEYASASGLQSY
jgi:hypothetical protein